jgi:hypothetical protein
MLDWRYQASGLTRVGILDIVAKSSFYSKTRVWLQCAIAASSYLERCYEHHDDSLDDGAYNYDDNGNRTDDITNAAGMFDYSTGEHNRLTAPTPTNTMTKATSLAAMMGLHQILLHLGQSQSPHPYL